jgi:copper(I)-binding protein
VIPLFPVAGLDSRTPLIGAGLVGLQQQRNPVGQNVEGAVRDDRYAEREQYRKRMPAEYVFDRHRLGLLGLEKFRGVDDFRADIEPGRPDQHPEEIRDSPSPLAQSSEPVVKDAWARATPGGAQTGAAYVTIVSRTDDRLTAVASPVAKTVQLHTMSMDGGIMRMRPVAAIDIPAGEAVTLRPGGFHIMLEGLKQPLHEGQSFLLTLSFEKAGDRQVTVIVEKPGSKGPAGQTGGKMPMHMSH